MTKALNLVGGLPFPDKNDRRRAPRVLRPSVGALTPKQGLSESQHQQMLFQWLRWWFRYVPELGRTYHVANEHHGQVVTRVNRRGQEIRYAPSAVKRQKEGVSPGILDVANHGISCFGLDDDEQLHGLFIDLKVRGEVLTNNPTAPWDQVREVEWLRRSGKSAHAAWSWAEAAALHAWYFDVHRRDLWCSIGPLAVWLDRNGGHDTRCGCGVNLEVEMRFRTLK